MGRNKSANNSRLVVILIIVLFLGYMLFGCSSTGDNTGPNKLGKTKKVALYFSDEQAIYLVPEERDISYGENLPQTLVEELVKGPQTEGLFRTLPQTTQVQSVQVENSIAYVDLSKNFEKDYPGGTTGEGMALGSIVQTLTEVKDIDAVQFLIGGKKVEVLAKGHISLNKPLKRHFILGNIETGNDKNEERQELVDEGLNTWLLDPLQSARADGPLYGLYALGEYELIEEIEQGEYSGIGEALVRHSYKGENYDVKMIQPGKQGTEGIWIINSIMPYGTKEEALQYILENKVFSPSQGGKAFSVYELLGEKMFDNRKTLYLWALCKEYIKKGDTVEEIGGLSVPVELTLFAQDENHNQVLEYQVPLDGKDYWSSIQEIFPQEVHDKISKRQGNVKDMEEILKNKAAGYFK